jgi:hypothetical protein
LLPLRDAAARSGMLTVAKRVILTMLAGGIADIWTTAGVVTAVSGG